MSSPTPVQPPEHTNSQLPIHSDRSVGAPNYQLPKYAWPVALVVLAVGAFLIGQRLAPAPEPTVIENGSPVTDASGLPLPDGKGGEVVFETTDCYAYASRTAELVAEGAKKIETQDISLAIDWKPIDVQLVGLPNDELVSQYRYHHCSNYNDQTRFPHGENIQWRDFSEIHFEGIDSGTVTGGTFAGYRMTVNMGSQATEIGGENMTAFYLLEKPGFASILLIDRVSSIYGLGGTGEQTIEDVENEYGLVSNSKLRLVKGIKIPNLDLPAQIETPKAKLWKVGVADLVYEYPAKIQAAGSIQSSIGPLIELEDGDFSYQRPDGRKQRYGIEIPFATSVDSKLPAIRWMDGTQPTTSYTSQNYGGCGFTPGLVLVDEAKIEQLKVAGSFSSNGRAENIYFFADDHAKTLEGMFDNWKFGHGGDAASYDAFLLTHPVFYWRDPFGRLIEFISSDAIPQMECGKPVIYLYPEETTDVSVKVAPQGGFTYTDPEYGTGWEVVAQPDGALTNKADGKAYPYLFWEGRGGLYQSPEKYWVIAKADVPSFIISTLTRLGLNSQEIADFNEFWLPRMEAAPYYKVGFHGTRVMDQLAPLDISPRPDTIFRVLMDYEELSAPIEANPPTLPRAFVRNGFTVVEWGGVIR